MTNRSDVPHSRRAAPALLVAGLLYALTVPAGGQSTEFAATSLQTALSMLRAENHDAAAQLAELTATDPVAPQTNAWLVAAVAHQRRRDYGEAIEAYRQFLRDCDPGPARQYALQQLALCQAGRTEPRPATPPSESLTVNQRAAMSDTEDRLFVQTSQHFVVQSRNAALSQRVAAQAERTLAWICHVLLSGAEYPHTVEIVIHPTAEAYRANVQSEIAAAGSAAFELTLDEQGYTTRRIHLTQLDEARLFDTDLLDRALPHELCHLVTTEWFGDSSCPRYLHEGLAMLAESAGQQQRVLMAGTLIAAGRALPLNELLTSERLGRDRIDAWYAQAYSFTAFLRQRLSDRQFADLLRQIKSGCTVADALHRSLNMPPQADLLARLERAWQAEALAQAQVLSALKESAGQL